ncbi:MAG TPA: short-chain fatty acyl-CoA regulator family protein [Afifellaceae bacterium]|nr:short-chain fatty acyl-CoA regulator family protein [Afifellaceae bacterium]
MAERKVFAGPRLRRVRMDMGLSQTDMAGRLEISPSYLNLIERNQRPLTVQVLLKLSSVFNVDIAELQSDADGGAVEALKEAFSDPLLAAELPSQSELLEAADVAPNLARGVARLHAAYREALQRLSDLSHMFSEAEGTAPERPDGLPFDRIRGYFESRSPWFAELEAAAAATAASLKPRDDPWQALKTRLRDAHGVDVRILPLHTMPTERSRFDRHSMRLFISERVPVVDRTFLLARQLVLLTQAGLLDRMTEEAGMADAEAARLCRLAFADRLASAVLVPADRLKPAARDLDCNIARLADRFAVRRSRIMARLCALGAEGEGTADGEGAESPAMFFAALDTTGAVLAHVSASGFSFPRYGSLCGRLPVFDGLQPGMVAVAPVVLPDGSLYAIVAIAEAGISANDGGPPPVVRSFIGMTEAAARQTVYRLESDREPRPVGVTCRVCERQACPHRSHPPATRPAAFHDFVVGLSDHELA